MPIQSADLDRSHRSAPRWPRGTVPAVALAAAATIAGGVMLGGWFDERALVWRAGVLALGGGSLVLWFAARRLTAPTFGAANTVTLARAVLVLLLLAALGVAAGNALAWVLVALSSVAALLDGVDGALARGRGQATEFGARFDMETDALLILTLAALVWQHGKAGVWILLAGLLRYLFVAASYASPRLGLALPPSRRRQAVCVVQIVSLIAALAPFVAPPASVAVAFAGLLLLVWSFGLDVAWLARRARS
jgi:phosphatidylglycerophosphate synthase